MENSWNWFSWHWFSPEQLRNFHWENQFFLLLIPAVPILFVFRWLFYFSIREKFDVALPSSAIRRWNFVQILKLIPITVQILFLICILIAIARPQSVDERIDQYSEGINILLVMDISESMQLEDLNPNRLEASKEVARKFISGRSNDRIGVVVFAGEAYSLSPLTNDYELVNQYIKDINFNMIENSGTAIGSALGVSINRLNLYKDGAKVIILLSDGENTAGVLDPIAAAKLAYAYNIKVYTIGIGKDGEASYGRDSTGRAQMATTHLDETLLRSIASQTKGSFYRAVNTTALNDIFTNINKLEKGKVKETRYKDTQDYYHIYLSWAIILFLFWLLLKNSFLNNFLED